MNIIHIDEKAHGLLNDWSIENKCLIDNVSRNNEKFFKQCVISFDGGYVVHYKHKNRFTKANVKMDGRLCIRFKIEYTPNGENQFGIHFNFADGVEVGDINAVNAYVKMFALDYITVNALFIYGNVIDSKVKIMGKSENADKHYFIREYDGKLYVVNSHSHKSPDGVFSVRGHFRKYKNGKIIWIDEYLKGIQK